MVSSAKLYVPEESLSLYKEAPVWSDFTYASEDVELTAGTLYMANFSITPGGSTIEPVSLKTSAEYVGCQFELELPEGLSIANKGVALSRYLNSGQYAVLSSPKSDNTYIVILYSTNHISFPTGDIDLVDIEFQATQSFKGGTINVTNIEFSKDSGDVDTAVDFDPSTCEVILDGIPTSITEIKDLENVRVDVYNVSGVVIGRNVYFDEIRGSLAPGLYILRTETSSQKVFVR